MVKRDSKRRGRSGKKGYLPTIVAALIVITVIWVLIWSSMSDQSSSFHHSTIEPTMISSFVDVPQLDDEWLPVLRKGKIIDVIPYDNGLSEKYKAIFDTGHQAMIKPAEPISIFGNSHSVMSWNELSPKRYNTLSRADRKYQGWAEIAAFYLDRVMGFNKKPPITGRIMTNKELFEFDDTWKNMLKKNWPQFNVLVSVHAWVEQLHTWPPGNVYMRYLIHENVLDRNSVSTVAKCSSISDALVFDLLVDDHDKKFDFNWKATANNINLHWDSGLGWRHGPKGIESCLNILCGTSAWIEENLDENGNCKPIKIFRNETIQYLRKHDKNQPYDLRLSTLWANAMKEDPLYPIFNLGSFWDRPTKDFFTTRVKFETQAFIDGLDERINLLLNYVDDLVLEHGVEHVLY